MLAQEEFATAAWIWWYKRPISAGSTYVYPARSTRQPTNKQMAQFSDLPNELIQRILGEVDISTLLRARLVNRASDFAGNGWSVLEQSEVVKTLYVHPSPRALKRVLEICTHSELSGRIETLHFLGRLNEQEWHRDLRQYSWPQFFSMLPESPHWAGLTRPADSGFLDPQNPTAEEAYRLLLELLKRLPRLHTLKHSAYATKPGLNMVSRRDVDRWVWTIDNDLLISAREALWSDAEILLALLEQRTSTGAILTLYWDEELCRALARPRKNQPLGPMVRSTQGRWYIFEPIVGLYVTRVSLCLAGQLWTGTPDEQYTTGYMLCQLPHLQDLRILFRGIRPGQDSGTMIPLVPNVGTGLRTYVITHLPPSLPLQRVELTSTCSPPPTIHRDTWQLFITKFRHTLKHLVMRDIGFMGGTGGPAGMATYMETATRLCLSDARNRLSLETADIFVRRRYCASLCMATPTAGPPHLRGSNGCDLYFTGPVHTALHAVTARMYERLAQSLQVTEGPGGGWDFSDYVLGR